MKQVIQEKIAVLEHLSDDELLIQIKHNDNQRAFAILMGRYKDKVKGLAFRLLYNSEAAEDAMQDVFCTVWRTREKWDIDGAAQFSTWIYRVTVNRCVDVKRKMRPQVDINDIELAHDDQTDLRMRQNELAGAIRSLLADLPTNQALALRMYYLEDKTIPDIASDMGKSELSVRSMIKRGKAGLREHQDVLSQF
jgi:RNA polymerase sigma-70 factor (ECF subfamily)